MTIKKIDKFDRAFAQFLAASKEISKGTSSESEIAELIVAAAIECAEHSKFLKLCSIAHTIEDALKLYREAQQEDKPVIVGKSSKIFG